MVFSGKPSKACSECRLRRTKCDTLKPSCSQCTRAGRICRGYRDPAELRFKDGSYLLSAKCRRSKQAQEVPVALSQEGDLSLARKSTTVYMPQFTRPDQCHVSPLVLDPGTSAEEQATWFFFRNYVLDEHEFHHGNFHYLEKLYGREEIGTFLTETVACLGLVGLANFWKSSNIMARANSKYNSALRSVNSRLRNLDQAKSDQTLVAVMLLGLYETNTCNSPQSMRSWTKHIKGATTLLSLRGEQHLRTPVGHDLFVHLRTQVITSCMQRHVPVPSNVRAWSESALDYEIEEAAASTRLSNIAIKFCNLRASMGSFNDFSNPEELISRLDALDLEFEGWLRRLPTSFAYITINVNQPSEEVFSGFYHVYSSIWTATLWNNYRTTRLLVNELLSSQIRHVLQNPTAYPSVRDNAQTYQTQLFTSKSLMLQLPRDICASVPFFLGYSSNASEFSTRTQPKAICGNLLTWPLYTAACTDTVSELLRRWVVGRLNVIAEVTGIRQATSLAHLLGTKQEPSDWQRGDDDQIEIVAQGDWIT